MFFGGESAVGSDLGETSRSGGGLAEEDSLKRRDFSIISRRESISFLYLAWIAAIAMATAEVTTLVMNYLKAESMIWELAVISSKQTTALGNLSVSVSQEESWKWEEADVTTLIFFLERLRRMRFIGSVAAMRLTSSFKVRLMREAFLLPVSRWNPWIARARLSTSSGRERKAPVQK